MTRKPAVAGQFYTSDALRLRAQIETLSRVNGPKKKVKGIISPHAGYVYSGAVSGEVYGRIEIPATALILGPNHHGFGPLAAVSRKEEWMTPLGSVPVNARLAERVLRNSPLLKEDMAAHQYEHSIEVQVPFLQVARPDISIVPICLGMMDFESCRNLGISLAKSIREYGEEVLIVASSDMSHYEPDEVARQKDEMALREIVALNPAGLYSVVVSRDITMCGVIPTAVMLTAALELGATKCELIRYATSGEVSGDYRQVVGYAGVTVE
ncbi:MAG: AmmeMemoRadiSam system protein B [Geobacteraceae bacterium]|nr:AmmeMemoRadiSam system protein B [Geobacteraceae bacterium]